MQNKYFLELKKILLVGRMCTNFAVISDSIKKVIKNFQKALPFKEAVEEIEKCIKELIFY